MATINNKEATVDVIAAPQSALTMPEGVSRLLILAIKKLDVEAVRVAESVLPGGITGHVSVPEIGNALAAGLSDYVCSFPEDEQPTDAQILTFVCFMEAMALIPSFDYLRRDSDGTTAVHHMFKEIISDDVTNDADWRDYLGNLFFRDTCPDLTAAFFSDDNNWHQDAIAYGLSETLKSTAGPNGVGEIFASTMFETYLHSGRTLDDLYEKDINGISKIEMLTLEHEGSVDSFIRDSVKVDRCSLERVAWLIANKQSFNDGYFINFQSIVKAGFDASPGEAGAQAGDHLFNAARRYLNSIDVLQDEAFNEESRLEDVANSLLLLMCERPELCPVAFNCEARELLRVLDRLKPYATQTKPEYASLLDKALVEANDYTFNSESGNSCSSAIVF